MRLGGSINCSILAAIEPPVSIHCKLGKICSVTVYVATRANSVQKSLADTMFVRKSNIKTDVAETNASSSLGAVSQLKRVQGMR